MLLDTSCNPSTPTTNTASSSVSTALRGDPNIASGEVQNMLLTRLDIPAANALLKIKVLKPVTSYRGIKND